MAVAPWSKAYLFPLCQERNDDLMMTPTERWSREKEITFHKLYLQKKKNCLSRQNSKSAVWKTSDKWPDEKSMLLNAKHAFVILHHVKILTLAAPWKSFSNQLQCWRSSCCEYTRVLSSRCIEESQNLWGKKEKNILVNVITHRPAATKPHKRKHNLH